MSALLLLVLWPLDVSTAAPSSGTRPLALTATLDGERRVSARLTNTGSEPIQLYLGYTCSGPEPFALIVDGRPRPLWTVTACDKNVELRRTLARGQSYEVASEALDAGAHRVRVAYHPTRADAWRGDVASPWLDVPAVAPWTITYSHSIGIDHGDGVTRGTTSTRLVLTPGGVETEQEATALDRPPTSSRRHDPLAAARRDALAALIPQVLALGGDYALSPFVPDEGWDQETIAVQSGGRRCNLALSGGRSRPYPPPAVVSLYKLVTGLDPPPPR